MQQTSTPLPSPAPQTQASRSLRNRLINLSAPPRTAVSLAPTSPVNPNWVGATQLGINTPRFASSVFLDWQGESAGLFQDRIMKMKNRTSEIFRETDPIMVQRDYGVRPDQPAIVQTRCKWIIGDVTEVLDRNTWKLGKIAKMLSNNYFVIRLADCIQLKEFHISNLRVPLQNAPAAPHSKQFPAANKATQRGQQPPAGLLRRSGKKRKSTAVLESPQPRQIRSTQPQKKAATADHLLQYRLPRFREEEAECSVASCSANDNAPDHLAGAAISNRRCCSVGRGDAMSAARVVVPCTTSGRESDGVLSDGPPAAATAADVHELELEAYRSTVRALHASGPLTWEQESLLTNLRLSLNISNEEHLLQLRRLLSS